MTETTVDLWFIRRQPSSRTGIMRGYLVFPHPERPGDSKVSSAIVSVVDGVVETASGSRYRLGTPAYPGDDPTEGYVPALPKVRRA